MSAGAADALGVVERWQTAVNAGDAGRAQALCDEGLEIAGPRGTVTGRAVLAEWLERSGFSATPTRWFCGRDGASVVVEQHAAWALPDGTTARAVVASQFTVRGSRIARYARHDDLPSALVAAGLDERDEAPAVVAAGAGELLGDAPDRRVELLCDRDPLHVTWSRFGPGRDGADLHVHRRHTDVFVVLDGELTVRLGPRGEPRALSAGSVVLIPPLVVHGFRNAGAADVRYLNLHAPGRGFAAYMRGLRDRRPVAYDQHDPPADGGRSPRDIVVADAAGALADDERIAVRERRAEPGGTVAALPGDRGTLDALYVLEGEVSLVSRHGAQTAPAGAWAHLPAGLACTVTVTGGAPGRVVHVRAPVGGSPA